MTNILAIANRELRAYFATPIAYVVMAVFLVLTGYFFATSPLTFFDTAITGFLNPGSFVLLLISPILTMRLFAEEQKLGTIELLLTAPVRDAEVVAGKLLASLGILAVMLALTLYYPLLLFIFGSPDQGPILSGYLGLFLLGGVFLSAGLLSSSITSNQIVAAVVGLGILLGLWLVGSAASLVTGLPATVLSFIALSSHFPDFAKGVIDITGVVYYLTLTALFFFLTVRSLESRRWR